jgi:hypothetical protein
MVGQAHAVQSAKPSRSAPAYRSASNPKLGNQAAQWLLRDGVIQAKLTVNQPGDKFEQEAERMAETVMRMPEPGNAGSIRGASSSSIPAVQRMCPECQEELHRSPILVQRLCSECGQKSNSDEDREGNIQAKEVPGRTPEVTPTNEAEIDAIRGGGQPLPESERAFFEPRFGWDFSDVHIHADAFAAESARSVTALAYTVGSHIVFGAGQYQPGTSTGRTLLAHELTHTIQQSSVPSSGLAVASPSIQRACGSAIGRPSGCTLGPPVFAPGAGLFRFNVNCDDFAGGQDTALVSFAAAQPATTTFEIHAFASVDGLAVFNQNLACARALKARTLLTDPPPRGAGIPTARITAVINHGPTPVPTGFTIDDLRSVVLRTTAPPPPPIPPLPPPPPAVAGCRVPVNPDRSGRADNPTTDGENFNIAKNPIDAFSVDSCRDKAFAAAGASGLIGAFLGPQDAFRHCFWNCCMAQSIGVSQAEKFATAHENSNPSAIPFDNQMDLHDNVIGRSLGTPGADCKAACASAVSSGLLRTVRRPPTVPTGCIGPSDQPFP